MNVLNNILLRVENYSPTYILFIDFLICLVASLAIFLLSSLVIMRHNNTLKFSLIKFLSLILYLVIWAYFIKTCIDLPVIAYLPNYKSLIIPYSDKIFNFCIYLAIIISLFKFLYKTKQIFIEKKKQENKMAMMTLGI